MAANDRVSQIAGHLNHPNGLLYGQTAIVTGAAQGIGAEIARLFVSEGARVIVSDIDGDKAAAVARALGERALAVKTDILQTNELEELVRKAAAFGGGKIHILVNNAGFTWDSVIHKASPTTEKQWETMLAVHATAPFQLIRAAAPYFRVTDNEQRCIINISSASGLHGNAGQANYATAKAGLVGLTTSIAKEWGPKFGVRANTVSFGAVATRLTAPRENSESLTLTDGTKVALGIPVVGKKTADGTRYSDIPLQRAAAPSEAASAVLTVASPLFSYVTGQTIEVNGGKWM